MNVIKATSKLTVVRIINAVLTFGGLAYFARHLGPTQLGIYFLFVTLITVFTIPVDLGIRGAVQKRISEGDSPDDYMSTGAVLKIFPIIISIMGILIFSEEINDYLGYDLSFLLIIGIVLNEYSTYIMNVLKGELEVEKTALVQLLQQVTWLFVGVTLVTYGFEAKAIV